MNASRPWLLWQTGVVSLLVALSPCAAAEEPRAGPQESPSLAVLLELYCEKISSPQFLDVARLCKLRLYKRTETVLDRKNAPGRRLPLDHLPAVVAVTYGGSGLLVTTICVGHTTTEASRVVEDTEFEVAGIQLIVGKCEEQVAFGVWQGELPKIKLPLDETLTPTELLAAYPHREHSGPYQRPYRTIVVYYHGFFAGPFSYNFIFDHERLALLEVFPPEPLSSIRVRDLKRK